MARSAASRVLTRAVVRSAASRVLTRAVVRSAASRDRNRQRSVARRLPREALAAVRLAASRAAEVEPLAALHDQRPAAHPLIVVAVVEPSAASCAAVVVARLALSRAQREGSFWSNRQLARTPPERPHVSRTAVAVPLPERVLPRSGYRGSNRTPSQRSALSSRLRADGVADRRPARADDNMLDPLALRNVGVRSSQSC